MMGAMTWLAAALALCSTAAAAQPGLDAKVYGARIEPGVTEFEARYGRLTGKQADGVSALVLEVSHGFSDRFYGALLATVDHEPGSASQLSGVAVEGIYRIGTIPGAGIDVAIYGEYAAAFRNQPHNLEAKILLEKRAGGWNSDPTIYALKVDKDTMNSLGFSTSPLIDFASGQE